MTAPLSVLFAGGGTGGHLFPGIAMAEALRSFEPDACIAFAGSARKIEARVVPAQGYAFDPIWIAGLRRSFSLSTALLPLKLAVSIVQSARIIRQRQPDVVVGTGGYVSGPVLWTAARLGVATLIHEQNEYPGATTRQLAPLVDEVHVTFDSTREHLARARRIVVSGNPVRPSLRRIDRIDACRRFGLDPAREVVFVFGGSLGASSINRAVRAALPRMMEADVQVLWQTGAGDAAEIREAVASFGSAVSVHPFIDDMSAAYSAASLVVCRAGATSLAEISAIGAAVLLVPYPHAAADHQRRNARAMEEAGAAAYLDDADLPMLGDRIRVLMRDADLRARLAAGAAAMAHPNAATDLARAILALAATSRERRKRERRK